METQPFDIDAPVFSRSPSPPGIVLEPTFADGLPQSPKELDSSEVWDKTELMKNATFYDSEMCEKITGINLFKESV